MGVVVCAGPCVWGLRCSGVVVWLVSVWGFVMCIDLNLIKSQIGDPRILWLVLKDAHMCGPLPLSVSCASLFRGRNAQTF